MMKTCLILVILGFTQIVYCCDLTNITNDDSFSVCPVHLFRRKRAITEYTRWRATLETTPEFLVKVLDEDLTTPNTKEVIAVNIQPVTRGGEKIIVGGVIVPSTTTAKPVTQGYRDYTRFVPPTSVPVSQEQHLQPIKPPLDVLPPVRPNMPHHPGRHSQRDESPPASPQFILRTSSASYARQFAPIAPVAFTRRPLITIAERKPTPSYTLQKIVEVSTEISPPKRTSEHPEIIWPQRTRPEFTGSTTSVEDDLEEVTVTNTSPNIMYNPFRTSTIKINIDEEPVIPIQRSQDTELDSWSEAIEKLKSKIEKEPRNDIHEYRKMQGESGINADEYFQFLDKMTQKSKLFEKADNESDNMYSMMFDGYGENENKKEERDYDDKGKTNLEVSVTTGRHLEDYEESPEKKKALENIIESESIDEMKNNSVKRKPTETVYEEETESTTVSLKEKSKDGTRQICNLIKLSPLNFNTPRTLAEITFQLKEWAGKSPLVKLEDITNGNLTTMENPIYLVSVDDPSSGQIMSAKQNVMIVAGIQGRDHHAVTAAMYVLYQLIERSQSHTDLLTKYRFWIIPVFNPDGYDYSMTFPHRREWAKNMRQSWEVCKNREVCAYCELYGLRCTVQSCYGVNLDRNFEYQWIPAKALKASHPCGALNAGVRQLSETETRSLTDFLHTRRAPFATFIAFKEGAVLGVMYPYSHTRKLRAFDHIHRQRAKRAASAAYSISGRPYVAGQTSEFLPLYAGGIEDWVDGHLGIDNTYAIMMFRPTDSYNSKLITERVVHEAYAAMDTLLLQSVEAPPPPPSILKRVNSSPKQFSLHYCILIVFTALLLQLVCY